MALKRISDYTLATTPLAGTELLEIETAAGASRKVTAQDIANLGAAGSGMTNPMTTVGDLIVGGTAGAPTRLAAGTATHVLTANGAGVAPTFQAVPAGGASGGTPALTLGAANTAGVAATFLRTDDTILAFDATVPSTQAFGDAAAVGAATVAARRDHKHAMPAAPTTITGNAGTATALATPRAINGVNFDGSAAITINAVDATARLAASAVSVFGATLIDDADSATARTTLGLGTLATQSGTFSGTSSGTNTGDNAGVTAVTGTAPIVSTGGATPALSIPAATASVAGHMTAAAMTKLDGIATAATANSSNATLLARANHTGTQLAATISDFAASVIATVLTGLSLATSTAVTAADSILVAIGKLQAQVTLRATLASPTFTGTPAAPTATAGTATTQLATTAFARTPSVQSVSSSATVTPTFADDMVIITAQAVALTLANPTGTAIPSLGIVIRIKDNATARAITYGTQYRAIGITLPTTTVISKTTYIAMVFNSTDTKWDCVATGTEA